MPSHPSRSLRTKFLISLLLCAMLTLAVAGLALALNESLRYRQSWGKDLALQAGILGSSSAAALAFDDPRTLQQQLQLLRQRQRILAAAVYNARGRTVAVYRRDAGASQALPALPETDLTRVVGDHIEIFKRVIENGEIVGTVFLRAEYRLRERLLEFAGILASSFGLSLLVALALGAVLQRGLTRPILALAETTRAVLRRQDFGLRVPKSSQDEVGDLVDGFNAMLQGIEQRNRALEQAKQELEAEVAERQHAEAQLRQLNEELESRVAARTIELERANKELEGFSYSVSHDLRAPLRGVIGFAEALIEDHGEALDEEARRKLAVVRSEAQRMGQLIDDLLAFSRLGRQALQMVDIDMDALVAACWLRLAQQQPETARVQARFDPLPRATADRALLTQVWANLLSNAVKFSARREPPQLQVGAIVDGAESIYYVRDNGAGFDPRYQDKLFGVFQRLHHQSEFAGTGVGLALVQRIVQRHGGRVWAEGRLDQGATFYFSLPRGSHEPEL